MKVLFVCVENAGRSQMAEAFARSLGLEAYSCGSSPAQEINPVVVEAMQEIGMDVSSKVPKGFDAVPEADVVVTMGCGDLCPRLPGGHYEWNLSAPKGKGLADVRKIRDEIEKHVRRLRAELAGRGARTEGR